MNTSTSTTASNNIFKIVQKKSTTSKARCGILLNNTTTPNIICNTCSCALPLITPDLIDSNKILKDSIGKLPFAIPVEDVILEKDAFNKTNNIHQHSNISASNLIFFAPRLCGTLLSGPSNDKQLTVETVQGRRGINVDTYFSLMNCIQADINISLCDEVPNDASKNRHDKSVRRTLNWLKDLLNKNVDSDNAVTINKMESKSAQNEPVLKKQKVQLEGISASSNATGHSNNETHKPILFGVVLGGTNVRLRKISAECTAELPVDGYVLGGFNLGETNAERGEILTSIIPMLNENKCRVLKCANNPIDVLEAIRLGIDLIECNYPYEMTRMGYASIYKIPSISYDNNVNPTDCPGGNTKISMRDKRFETDVKPLLPGCQCFACKSYTRAYVNHLLNAHEMLAETLLYIHNLYHLQMLVSTARKYILDDKYDDFVEDFKLGLL